MEGFVRMEKSTGIVGRFAVLLLFLMAGAVYGQEQAGISCGESPDVRSFTSIRLIQDAKSGAQSGTQSGSPTPPQAGNPAEQTTPMTKPAPTAHRFWDKQNILLFAGVGAARGLDYASTLNIRRRGINEALLTNAIVDDHAEFAAIEATAAAASVGLSYIFHATGHHKLERWTSYIHIGVTVAGAGRNYALKTVHPTG